MSESSSAVEANFDGLVGPTHNYGGLSDGNVASLTSKRSVSYPKAAALQGLEKMRTCMELGLVQGVLPPQERPFIPALKNAGFSGSDAEILAMVAKENPLLLVQNSSAACMWVANAATVVPSADTTDHRVHFTPANLRQMPHRAIEPKVTARVLKASFPDDKHFKHHAPLESKPEYGDEGAANHSRFCMNYGEPGVNLYVYGRDSKGTPPVPQKYPARQTLEACQTLALQHLGKNNTAIFAKQLPRAIDAGAFHNDVVSVGNKNVFLYHEDAFCNTPHIIEQIEKQIKNTCKTNFIKIPVFNKDVSLDDAVKSYLFNSQLVSLPNQKMALLAPSTCEEMPNVMECINKILRDTDNPLEEVRFFNLHQSMKNGGGPACLRLRVVLNKEQLAAVNQKTIFTKALYESLKAWVGTHYREKLEPQDLADPALLQESRAALDELSSILGLGNIYDFQKYS